MGQKDIGAVSETVDAAVKTPLKRVIEAVQIMLGFRGDVRDKAVVWGDLFDQGIATFTGVGAGYGDSPGYIDLPGVGGGGAPGSIGYTPDLSPPPTPIGFAAVAGFSEVIASWDPPLYTEGHGHLQTNLYAVKKVPTDATLPTFADAARFDEIPGSRTIAAISSELNTRWHIWIKWETVDGVESTDPAGGVHGVTVTTGQDITQLLEVLTGSITASQLYSALGARIDLIDGSGAGSVNARIATEASTRQTADGSLFAQYTVKLDVNGYVSGFGLASTLTGAAPYSTFLIRADSFAIAAPSGPGITPITPFIVRTTSTVENGVTIPVGVYMDSAYIVNLSAMYARIGNLVSDSITAASISAAQLTVGDGTVGGNLKSTTFTSGSVGWQIQPNGYAEFNNIVIRGAVYTGTIYAGAGTIGGITISMGDVRSPGYVPGSAGFRINADGTAEFYSVTARGNITANSLNAATGTFTGSLVAVTGTIGDLTIATGGALHSGQTAYNTGVGFWQGIVSGVPKWSIGDPSGPNAVWDGSNFYINGATLDGFSASISGGDIGSNSTPIGVPAGSQFYGSRSVSVSGGKSPFTYRWVITPTIRTSNAFVSGGAMSATASLSGGGELSRNDGLLTCFVSDANGRVTMTSISFFALHGDPGGGGDGGS